MHSLSFRPTCKSFEHHESSWLLLAVPDSSLLLIAPCFSFLLLRSPCSSGILLTPSTSSYDLWCPSTSPTSSYVFSTSSYVLLRPPTCTLMLGCTGRRSWNWKLLMISGGVTKKNKVPNQTNRNRHNENCILMASGLCRMDLSGTTFHLVYVKCRYTWNVSQINQCGLKWCIFIPF